MLFDQSAVAHAHAKKTPVPETKEELYGSYDQKTMNAETQAPESRVKTPNAETQTTEFEYLFKQAVL